MKKQLLLLFTLIIAIAKVDGQTGLKNGVSANLGFGFSGSSHSIYSFNIGYQREISKALYIRLEFTDIQGSQSFKSLFGEAPKLSSRGQFGEGFQLIDGQEEYLFGRLIQIGSWGLGLKKYIQLSPKIHMAGCLSVVTNSISEMDIEGIIYDANDNINYDDVYPVYATYRKMAGKVNFEVFYELNKTIGFISSIDYMSFSSIVTFSVGSNVSF